MKRHWKPILMVVILILAVWVNWPRAEPGIDVPPAMTLEQLAATPDAQLFTVATNEVRWKVLAASDGARRWRSLPDAARHVLALSWTEASSDLGGLDGFRGFSFYFGVVVADPNSATPTDIAEAYTAIGAPAVAEVILAAMQQPRPDSESEALPPTPDPFAPFDARFEEQRRKAKVSNLLRIYIRAHLDELVNARLGG